MPRPREVWNVIRVLHGYLTGPLAGAVRPEGVGGTRPETSRTARPRAPREGPRAAWRRPGVLRQRCPGTRAPASGAGTRSPAAGPDGRAGGRLAPVRGGLSR